MYQNILLTFDHIDGYFTYAWFETEDDARELAKNNKIVYITIDEVKEVIKDIRLQTAEELLK